MSNFQVKSLICCVVFAVAACSESDSNDNSGQTYITEFNADLSQSSSDWQAGFADYPVGGETDWELTATPNQSFKLNDNTNAKGFYLHSNNRSDDTQMFITKRIANLKPNTHFDVRFNLQIATNINGQCAGIGGAPHAVTVKAGLSNTKPDTSVDDLNHHRLNIDFGNQAQGGLDGVSLGDIANEKLSDCDPGSDVFAYKVLNNEEQSFEVTTDATGDLWLTLLTDSGFEGVTNIYFTTVQAKFSESTKSPDGFSENIDFSKPQTSVKPLFFDYPADRPFDWELTTRPQTAVKNASNESITGYLLHSYNRSDDTGMLLYKPVKGLAANTQYQADFNVTIASNVNNQCFGIGGAPHAVAVKAWISNEMPQAVLPGSDNHLRLNVDFGNNMQGSEHSLVLGDIGVESLADCDPSSNIYELKQFSSSDLNKSITFTTDDSGLVYFSVLTDSGFEGPTTMLFTSASVTFTKL